MARRHADQIHRQRRPGVTYVDAMTSICEGEPAEVRKTVAFALAACLTLGVASGDISDKLFLDLAHFPAVQSLRQSFKYRPESSKGAQILHSVTSVDQIETAGTGRDGIGEGRVRRSLEIDLAEAPGLKDWPLLAVYAVLAHLKCDLEVLLDTGFLPVRRCERHRCGAFYRVNRMSGQPRFCSNSCRACARREQSS